MNDSENLFASPKIVDENRYNLNLQFGEDNLLLRVRGKTKAQKVLNAFVDQKLKYSDVNASQLTLYFDEQEIQGDQTFNDIFDALAIDDIINLSIKTTFINPEENQQSSESISEVINSANEPEEQKNYQHKIQVLTKYQRQEVYHFLSTNFLFRSIIKLSKNERSLIQDLMKNSFSFNSHQNLRILPPLTLDLDFCDSEFWLFLQNFSPKMTLLAQNIQSLPKIQRNICENNQKLFMQMLPGQFMNNRRLSIEFQGGDFSTFLTILKKKETFFKLDQLYVHNSSIILSPNSKILTFLESCSTVTLIDSSISIEEGCEDSNNPSIKKLIYEKVIESVNHVLTIPSTCQTVKLAHSTIRISENFQNTLNRYATHLEIRKCHYKMQNKGVTRVLDMYPICKILSNKNSVEKLILEMEGEIKYEDYEELILKHLPNIKDLTIIVNGQSKVQLALLVKIGLLRKLSKKFRIVCMTQLQMINQDHKETEFLFSNKNALLKNSFIDLERLGSNLGVEIAKEYCHLKNTMTFQCRSILDSGLQFSIELPLGVKGVNLCIF